MRFKLTSSQRNFYNKNFTLDGQIWNQGVMEIFPKVYSYEEINNAYNKLVEIHDSLRVKLVETENGVVAEVREHEHTNYRFWQVDNEEELMQKAQDFLNEPTDRYGLLVDCAIFQTPTTSGIMINAHHIVVDGFSALVMSEHINNFLKDENFTPVIQKYPDYVEKEEKYKQSRRYAKSKEFWLKEFSGNPQCQIFLTAENAIDFSSKELNHPISAELYERIKAFCDEKEITPASFFNAVNATYIHKIYGVENFTVGVPVFNRTTADELNTIGLYMHLVPLVINVKNDTFIDNVRRIEDSQMNLFRHQNFTQQDIKDLLSENEVSVNQLFDVVSDFQEFTPNEEYEMRIPYGNSLSVPIEMHLQAFDEGKHNFKIRYRTAYFSEEDIQIMLKSIIALAENVLEKPNKNIFELEMISKAEKQKIINAFNNTAYTYDIPENTTLYSLFEQKSEENKDKVCIIANDEEITYKDFKAYAERIDNQIRSITKEEKSVIAVITERSFEMYGAVYGIIRGGNAYLPIDPNYPQERIDYILENSGAKAVVAQDKFCQLAGNTVCINATEVLKSKEEPRKTEILANEEDTAYVIYTSGSTGNPKGAKISHKSAINRILWMHDFYPLEENDVILQKTPYTFDVSVWELFWWGITGRTLSASKPDEHFLPAKILYETEKNKVTHLHFVPSVFDLFLTYLENNPEEQDKFNSVKYVFLSGEALTAKHINRFYNIYDYNKVSLHNLYGPTECAVDVSYYPCVPEDIDPVPIGKPIYNTQLYIVDKYLNPTPIGVTGELCIAGVNVGQGYLNNEALTNEKFIDNPFGEGKLYKTGDLAYWRKDGQICYVGRMDGQIKLNGQRVELGEIEKVISEVSSVESVAVIIKQNNGQDVIVAFCCGDETATTEVIKYCENKLPQYMVPSKFVFIEKMPLNQSGKLDRKALKNIEVAFDSVAVKEEPITETEKMICELFQNTLKIDFVGRNENFFNLGGTSLDMISILSQDELKNVSAAEFIANPTPEKLAMLFVSEKDNTEYLKCLWIAPNESKVLVLFPFAGGDVESYANLVESIKKYSDNISIYFVRYLHTKNECVCAAEEVERVLKNKPVYFYSHCVGSAVALQILNILENEGRSLVKHFISGGFIPLKKQMKKNIWNSMPNKILQAILTNAGAPLNNLSNDELALVLKKFRIDTDFSTEVFLSTNSKIKCPVSLVLNKKDVFTTQYKKAQERWRQFAVDVYRVHFIDSTSHYFQSDSSDALAEIIIEMM